MKKYVSVALATAMIASMGVTAFAKNDQYNYDVKDVTFVSKTDNGDDEVYFQLKLQKGSTDAFIVDDAKAANGDIADKEAALTAEKEAYTAAKAVLDTISDGDFTLSGGPTDESVKAAAEKAIDALGLDAEYTGKVKAAVSGLDKSSDADAVVNAIKAASTQVKGEYTKAKTAATEKATAYTQVKTLAAGDLGTVAAQTTMVKYKEELVKAIGTKDGGNKIPTGEREAIADSIMEALNITNDGECATNGNVAATVATKFAAYDDSAVQNAKTAADTASQKADGEDVKVQALTKAGVTMPAAGQVDVESMKAALLGKVEDGKYEAAIVNMVLNSVDVSYASAAEATAAIKAAAPKVIDEHIKTVQGQIDGLGKADYVAYDDIEDIDDLKVTLKLTAGEEYVADYYIDEIDDEGKAHDGNYAIILELNDNYTTSKQKIKGTVTLKNKTKKLEEMDFSYNLDINKVDVQGDGQTGDYEGIKEMTFDGEDVYINLVEFNNDYNVAKFTKDVENIELEDNNGFYFDVKASDQGKLNLSYDNVAVKSVARVAPVDADLTFYNFYGYPEFDFTGTVTITPEEDDVEYFVYKVAKDGKISKVNAKLNDDGDAYEFKTRTLGCYVLSDMELDVEDINAGEEGTTETTPEDGATTAPEAGKDNPGTGC